MVHILKIWPTYFEAVANGSKTFEVRRGDRAFRVGDELVLREWNPATERYTGREEVRVVTYLLLGGLTVPGLAPGYVCMSIARLSEGVLP